MPNSRRCVVLLWRFQNSSVIFFNKAKPFYCSPMQIVSAAEKHNPFNAPLNFYLGRIKLLQPLIRQLCSILTGPTVIFVVVVRSCLSVLLQTVMCDSTNEASVKAFL